MNLSYLARLQLGPKVEVALKVEGVDLDVFTRNVELEDDIDPKVPPSSPWCRSSISSLCCLCG